MGHAEWRGFSSAKTWCSLARQRDISLTNRRRSAGDMSLIGFIYVCQMSSYITLSVLLSSTLSCGLLSRPPLSVLLWISIHLSLSVSPPVCVLPDPSTGRVLLSAPFDKTLISTVHISLTIVVYTHTHHIHRQCCETHTQQTSRESFDILRKSAHSLSMYSLSHLYGNHEGVCSTSLA